MFAIGSLVCLGAVAPAHGADVEVHTIDGAVLRGRYDGIDEAGHLRLSIDGSVRELRLDDLHSIDMVNAANNVEAPSGACTFFAAPAGVFAGTITESIEGGVRVRTPFADKVEVTFDRLAAIRLGDERQAPDAQSVFDAELAARLPGEDVLVTRSTDSVKTVRGSLIELGPAAGRFLFQGRERSFKLDTLYGIVLAKVASGEPRPRCTLGLRDGSRLPGDLLRADAGHVAFETVFRAPLSVAMDGVRRIEIHSPRVVYVSALTPVRKSTEGLLHDPWPIRADRSTSNSAISMGGRHFEKGVGVHARTELAYVLDAQYERFCATVGIDDAVRPRGHVVFRVLGDGRDLIDAVTADGRQEPQEITADVTGVSELTLLVEFGEQLDLADHADWADARLIKPAPGADTAGNSGTKP